nr:copia protein [Tanacetum cinerariifolium]
MDHISLHPPTSHDIKILIKTCLMPLALKTQNDSLTFVHELKHEMHADLKYIESLEKEIDDLKSDKAKFSNMYDTILQECVSNDVMSTYLLSTKKPNIVPISTRKPKGHVNKYVATPPKKKVTSKTTTQKPKSYYRMLYEKTSKTWKWWIEQQCPSEIFRETTSLTPLCLMAKASSTQAWLWHRRLSHLNFDYINLLSKKDVVIGLPKLKYVKDQLCSSCEVSKAKRSSFKTKIVPSSKGRLNLLHMDLCGPMRVASINEKKYISFVTTRVGSSFGPLYDEFFDVGTSSVNKSSSPTDNYKHRDTPPTTNIQSSTEPTNPTNANAEENNHNQAEHEFINPFCTPVQEVTESSSYNIAELKNIKEAMADSAWIEAMQEELHQLDRLQDEEQTVIRNKVRLVAKSYAKEEGIDFEESLAPVARLTSNPPIPARYLYQSGQVRLKILKKHGMEKGQSIGTPMATEPKLDADLSGNPFLGHKLVSWMSKKHDCTAMSSAEAEYMALSESHAQVMWMRTHLKDYGFNYNKIPLYCDSQSAIAISYNPVQYSRTKTEYQLADMFTKSLPGDRFKYLFRRIGMRCLTLAELEKVEESLNVTFDETPLPSKTSPLVDDDLDEEEAIKFIEKKNLENDTVDETLEIEEIVNIKESRNHPLENVIGNLNQRMLRNKLDKNGIVSRNKARLVAQGHNQQEGINYDETYALVARLESIRIFLAYDCALYFKLFQMDVKSAFLNGFINEEVYMAQPSGFIDFGKPNHVYKLMKALYGLKQAPKAWYDRLKSFLIKHEYKIGMVDNTLFTKKKSSNLIIVEIYVDDIIFGLTCQDRYDEFSKIMHDEFEMSMMGELNFFLGLQSKQMEDGIFFNQSKYIKEMLKKFGREDSKPMKTPMSSDTKLTKDEECESVDSTKY